MARQLGVKPEEVVEMETRLTGQDIALEGNNSDEEDSFSPIAYLVDPNAEPATRLEQEDTARRHSEGLSAALSSLDDRSRRIIEARWLQEDGGATLHELAAEYGVSAERIRQIEQKAMQKMKVLIGEN
jgi:RNA polymerase sigma-32 factor